MRETGETTPSTDTLKQLSKVFDVSINTLLGEPQQLICQCCGMPLNDASVSREEDGERNEAYCKWCYADGRFAYENMEELIAYCEKHPAAEASSVAQVRGYMKNLLSQLDYWKRYATLGGEEKFNEFKQKMIGEINSLRIDGMPKVENLSVLSGKALNFEYELPNGQKVRFLDERAVYLGARLECIFDESQCFGIVAAMDFLLVCTYGKGGAEPELRMYQKR